MGRSQSKPATDRFKRNFERTPLIVSMFTSLRHMLPIRRAYIKSFYLQHQQYLLERFFLLSAFVGQKDLFALIDRLSWWWNVDESINQWSSLESELGTKFLKSCAKKLVQWILGWNLWKIIKLKTEKKNHQS